MDKHQKILDFLLLLRESHPLMVKIYTQGGCVNLFCLLHNVWPESECYYDIACAHVLTKIDDRLYDINGVVNNMDAIPFNRVNADKSSRLFSILYKYFEKIDIMSHLCNKCNGVGYFGTVSNECNACKGTGELIKLYKGVAEFQGFNYKVGDTLHFINNKGNLSDGEILKFKVTGNTCDIEFYHQLKGVWCDMKNIKTGKTVYYPLWKMISLKIRSFVQEPRVIVEDRINKQSKM